MDNDGFGDENQIIIRNCSTSPVGFVTNSTDFDDTNNARYPNAIELCDNIDNDGDTEVDEAIDFDSESLSFTNETIPSETYTASTTIETNQVVTISANTDVHLVAGQTIILKPGFVVAAGATFHAQIAEDCAASPLSNEIVATVRTSTIPSIKERLTMAVFPNPFRSQATIDFYLPKASKVNLQVYDRNGQLMETLLTNEAYSKGNAAVAFFPKQLMNGFYYIVLTTDTTVRTEKVVVIE